MGRLKIKGIFCLEGDWDGDLRRGTTVHPVLQLLAQSNRPSVPYIRRDIGTVPEFEYYLGKWTQRRYSQYPILYLGFHGDPGLLYIGDRRSGYTDLDWLEERLTGKCRNRVIHFGSCGTMATHGRRLNRFLERTNALAVCGYKTTVDWMLTAAFETILLSGFQYNAFTRSGIEAVSRRVHKEAAGLERQLQFRMEVAP